MEEGGEVLAAYLRPREKGEIKMNSADDGGEMIRSIRQLGKYYLSDPHGGVRGANRADQAVHQSLGLDAAAVPRRTGGAGRRAGRPDKRFADAEWRDNPFFDFIKQAYVLTTRWADDLVRRADEIEPHERDKARFLSAAGDRRASPSNFVATNPELLRDASPRAAKISCAA